MNGRWRRGCLTVLALCCLVPLLAAVLFFTGVRTKRLYFSPPAQIADLGPLWLGDFCRDNVAHGRYPPGWCPPNYTVYIVLRWQGRGSIHPLFEVPE